jgi:multisubunit Na+/H+ antiporter MnhG subunit
MLEWLYSTLIVLGCAAALVAAIFGLVQLPVFYLKVMATTLIVGFALIYGVHAIRQS